MIQVAQIQNVVSVAIKVSVAIEKTRLNAEIVIEKIA